MNYISITTAEVSNGPGVRCVLWVSGCSHRCKGCQNPNTWDKQAGYALNQDTVNKLLAELEKPYIRGLTLSGGDPLFPENCEQIKAILHTVKEHFPEKDIWLWTGYIWEEIQSLHLLKYVDVVVDGPYVESLRDITLPYRGSSNQRVIDVQKSLAEGDVVLYSH